MVSKQKAAAKEKNIKWLKYHNTIYTICILYVFASIFFFFFFRLKCGQMRAFAHR